MRGGEGVAQPNLLFPLQPFLLFLSVSPLTLPHPKVNPSLSSAIVGSCLGCNRRQHGVSSPLSLTPCFVPECESSVRQLSVTNWCCGTFSFCSLSIKLAERCSTAEFNFTVELGCWLPCQTQINVRLTNMDQETLGWQPAYSASRLRVRLERRLRGAKK